MGIVGEFGKKLQNAHEKIVKYLICIQIAQENVFKYTVLVQSQAELWKQRRWTLAYKSIVSIILFGGYATSKEIVDFRDA